ncbi:MAG: HD-GYP domain-containing protein [Proteobacteria bacterium]|nr:HD-GYP domain-containing protein [Pseudomonadota bacterium]
MVKRIPIADLRPGMRVARLESDAWMQDPTLYTREGTIRSAEDVASILRQGYREVVVQMDETEDVRPRTLDDLAALVLRKSPERHEASIVPFEEELVEARRVYFRAFKTASRVVMDTVQGKPVDMTASRRTVRELSESVARNREALGCLSKLTRFEAYLYSHMVNVTVFSLAFGRFIGLADGELKALGLAAFLHDIGKTSLPLAILAKNGRLTAVEREQTRRHPQYGVLLLKHAPGVTKALKLTVLHHHENFDGSGYPEGISGERINLHARILHLADIYDALTSDRFYDRPRTPAGALSSMYAMRGVEFAPEDVERFIKCLGIYPSGSLIRLTSGEVAVVLQNFSDRPLTPLVKVVLDPEQRPRLSELLDLGSQASGASLSVAATVNPQAEGIDMASIMAVF